LVSLFRVSWAHTYRRAVGLLWTSDQPVAEASTYTEIHNIETQETNIHAPSGIRTRDPSNRAAADLRITPCNKLLLILIIAYLAKKFPVFYGRHKWSLTVQRDGKILFPTQVNIFHNKSFYYLRFILMVVASSLLIFNQTYVCNSCPFHLGYIHRPPHSARFDDRS
jgi:hypothetical protein